MIAEPLLNTYPKSRHERVRLSSWAVLQSVATQNSAEVRGAFATCNILASRPKMRNST